MIENRLKRIRANTHASFLSAKISKNSSRHARQTVTDILQALFINGDYLLKNQLDKSKKPDLYTIKILFIDLEYCNDRQML